jgi:Type IV Pilus-assembly protein W
VTQSSTDFSSLAVPLGVIPQNSAFFGGHTVGAPDNQAADTIYTRFDTLPASNTTIGTGPILCNGTDTSVQPGATYTIAFTVSGGALQCSVDGGNTWVPIVPGVQALAVYYGINRNAPGADYNIDTYVTADMMQNPGDWLTVSAVRIVLSFANPMWVAGGTQPQYITVERVVQVMGRAGVVI